MAGRPTKDETLIKQNPNASPYELLQKGLSETKYNELVAKEETLAQHNIKEANPEPKINPEIKQVSANGINQMNQPKKAQPIVQKIIAQPITNKPGQMFHNGSDMAWLVDKTGKAKPLYMTREQAIRQVKKYPTMYELR